MTRPCWGLVGTKRQAQNSGMVQVLKPQPARVLVWLTIAAGLLAGCGAESTGSLVVSPPPAPRPQVGGTFTFTDMDMPRGRDYLIFGVAPTVGGEVAESQFQPVAKYLSSKLGRTVQLLISDSYAHLFNLVTANQVDFALIPPYTYVLAKEQNAELQILVSMLNLSRTRYSAFILVRHDDPAKSLHDLKGRRVALVEKKSTSGYLFPMSAFIENGIDPERDFDLLMTGSHMLSIGKLVAGEVDAAAVASGMLDIARHFKVDDALKRTRLRVLHKSGDIPYDALCATGALPTSAAHKITGAFQEMHTKNPEAEAALRATGTITGWVPGDDTQYDGIRRVRVRVKSLQSDFPVLRDHETH
jgi:phosphate/phosphite/phosphonate ABC transporter binding protein